MTLEYKNYRIDGPMMDQIVGASLRAKYRSNPSVLTDIFLFCRGYTADARQRADEIEQELKLVITFKIIS
jgi:hypothetical protein